MFISKQELSNKEALQKEEELRDLALDPERADDVFEELGNFFAERTLDEAVRKYGMTYWRWYVWLTWNRLNSLDQDDLVTVFAMQIPTAIALDFDAIKYLMKYFIANNYIENDIESLYFKIKTAFQDSQAILGFWQGQEVRVFEVVREVKLVTGRNNSLEQADFETRLHQIMFPTNSLIQEYDSINFGMAVQRFVDLCVFFDQVSEDKISLVVHDFLNSMGRSKFIETKQAVKPNFQQIKSQIESEFKKDPEGNFENIEGVMRKLEEFAEMYNDPKIADMIYYDEEDDKFKWKE